MDPSLLHRLRARASNPAEANDDASRAPARVFPPVDGRSIEVAEARLGFGLPVPLRMLYTTVGNGGFGPAYGFLGLLDGAKNEEGLDAVSVYESFREPDSTDPHWAWPASLLPVGHLGCAMFVCVDCNTDEGSLVWFEPNPHERGKPWDEAFIPLNISLECWLRRWLEGTADDLFEEALGGP